MPFKTRAAYPLLLILVLTACQLGAPATPTAPPVPNEPTSAATDTTNVIAPTSTATNEPSSALQPTTAANVAIENIKPVDAQIPSSFKVSNTTTFATFQPPHVAAPSHVEAPAVTNDLSNVTLTVLLSPEQHARIAQNGFAISPGNSKEFYELYERIRYDNVPPFISSDSILHTYHLLFDKTLRTTESNNFIPLLTRLDWELLNMSVQQYNDLDGTPWAEAARRNAAYFAVAVKLLNPDWPVPEGLRDLTDPDLASITAHSSIAPSAIFPAYPNGEDWSQYVPRGHYTKSEALKNYFLAMMWHGRMTFRAEDATETQQAALLTVALQQTKIGEKAALGIWSGIYEPTVFFVGRSDDLTPQEYSSALASAYGQIQTTRDLVDDAKFTSFQAAASNLRAPEILGMVVPENTDINTTKGLRFMGQRFVPDAFVFQQLVADRVPGRTLPKALDFFAALGSDRALAHLTEAGDTALPNYQTNLQKLRGTFNGYDQHVWTQNLYWSWIYSLQPLIAPIDENDPQFMQSDAWLDKQLNTVMGSWTELKHDTLLYSKQSYAEGSGGGAPEPVPPKGYVEPIPELYARIAAIGQMTIDGLDSRGLLSDDDKNALTQLVDIANRLKTIAEKQSRAEAPTSDEYDFLRFYGRSIEGLTIAAGDMDIQTGQNDTTDQAALVADVATDPAGQVLEEGIGAIDEIYVVVPVEGKLVLTKGGVFSHYEFSQPLSDRLTDEAWREQVAAGNLPERGAWTSSFFVEQKADSALSDTINNFNLMLVNAVWGVDSQSLTGYLTGSELSDTQQYIEQLKTNNQFVAMTRLSLDYLSFDFQDAQHATVTTRERWSDELFSGEPEEFGGNPTKIGIHPPYETTVTYTMQQNSDGAWLINKIITNPEPPAWQTP